MINLKQQEQHLNKLFKIGLSFKVLVFIAVLTLDSLFEDFDQSPYLLFKSKLTGLEKWLFYLIKGHVRWDSLFFIQIADQGYLNDKEHAFFPLFPSILSVIGHWSAKLGVDNKLGMMIGGYLMNSIIYFYLIKLVYKITNQIFNDEQMSYDSAILFIFSPSSIFYHSLYSECLFTLLSLLSVHHYLHSYERINRNIINLPFFDKIQLFYLPSLLIVISIICRSNGLFLLTTPGCLMLYYIIRRLYLSKQINSKVAIDVFQTVVIGLTVLFQAVTVYYLIIVFYPSQKYCNANQYSSFDYKIPEWCKQSIPNLYSYIQDKYWQVGLLQSYQPKRAFDIFWGFQSIIIMFTGIFSYVRYFTKEQKNIKQIPLFIYSLVMWIIAAFIAHIMSCTRFFSNNLFFIWSIYRLRNNYQSYVQWYLVTFNVAGIVLFSNYLIWV